MLDLAQWSVAARSRMLGVFTDIDDTLTTEGAITPDALDALARLHAVGLHVIPITGRPVGWTEPFAREWPVDAIVAENGAVALVSPGAGPGASSGARQSSLRKLYQQDEQLRSANFARMQRVAQRIVAEIPGATVARDSAGRETDIAVDHSEHARLPPERVAQVVRLMQDEGMNATVSSIHINGWFGDHNKLSGARWVVRELFGRELDGELDRWVYVGDSPNDALMFQHFRHSVGVANIRRFEAELSHPPKYVTQGERGAGFAELARAVLAGRQAR
jgi:HAD superfamily hydrolase (TIGR01484 family)